MRIVDIDKSHCRYPQFELLMQQYELSISTNRIVHISNTNYRFRQITLSMSTIRIIGTTNAQSQQYQLYPQLE